MYGDVSQVARNFGLKVSHAGNMKMHASKASGIFTSYQNAIGISFETECYKQALLRVMNILIFWIICLERKARMACFRYSRNT